MAFLKAGISFAMIILVLSACATGPQPTKLAETNRGATLLSAGITSYEEGEYDLADKNLKQALKLGLAAKADQIKAHKFLAFIYCISGRPALGEAEFRKAFELDPKFALDPAEAGHPLWGPVYLKVKASMVPVKKTS
jgi:Tfp pilus assembly protein PilF